MLQQPVTRRGGLASLATIAATAFLIGRSDQAYASSIYEFPRDEAAGLLGNAAWTPIGPNVSRKAYVLAAPWCPYCKALFAHIKRGQLPVQFRWISAWPDDTISTEQNVAIASHRTAAVIDAIYSGLAFPKSPLNEEPWLATWNEGVRRTISQLWKNKIGRELGAPQIWYGKPNSPNFGVHLGFGSSTADLRQFDSEISSAGIDLGDNSWPAALAFDAANIRLKHVQPVNLFAIKTPISLHAVPDEQSPIIDDLKPRTGLPVTQVALKPDGSQWAGLVVNSSSNLIGWALLKELFNGNGGKAFI